MIRMILILAFVVSGTTSTWGSCAPGKPVRKKLTVESCEVVDPYGVQRLSEFAERYPQGFVESYRGEARQTVKEILESYRGAVLTENEGVNTVRYFLAGQDLEVCSEFEQGDVLNVSVEFACCDGDPNPPCYLGFGSFLTEVK